MLIATLLLHIVTLLWLSALFAAQAKKTLLRALPAVFSLLMLALYLLCFVDRAYAIDGFCLCALAGSGLWLGRMPREKRQSLLGQVGVLLRAPAVLVFAVLAVLGVWLLSDRPYAIWDEFAFWAVDIKSMFVRNGFAPAGRECAPLFGVYPPGTTLAEYWFLHLFGRFDEGLTFSAYFFATLVFLAPLLDKLPKSKVVWLLAIPWLLTFGSFGPKTYDMRSPDVLMAMIYGCMLMEIADFDGEHPWFSRGKLALLAAYLALQKTVGIQWLLFAAVFQLVLYGWRSRKNLAAFCLPGVGAFLSWMAACRLTGRTDYLTSGAAAQLENGDIGRFLQRHGGEILKTFIKGMVEPQTQVEFFGGIALSALACLVFLTLAAWLVGAGWKRERTDLQRRLPWFFALSGAAEYLLVLVSLETIFAEEFRQFLYVDIMVLPLRRYAAPFTVGGAMLLAGLCLDQWRLRVKASLLSPKTHVRLACGLMCLGLLTSPLATQYDRLVGYRFHPEEENWVIPDGSALDGLLNSLKESLDPDQDRVCLAVLPPNSTDSCIRAHYRLAPLSAVLYQLTEESTLGDVLAQMEATGSNVLAFPSLAETAEKSRVPLAGAAELEYDHAYRIEELRQAAE